MKKIDLVHLTLLIVAILTGYFAAENLLTLLSYLPFFINPIPYYSVGTRASSAFTLALLYGIVCAVLVVNGRKYAAMLLRDDPEGSWEATSRWDLDRRNMLFILFIGLGAWELIVYGTLFLNDVYTIFSAKVGGDQSNAAEKTNYIVINLLRLTFGALLIYAAPNLTNFIEDKIAVRLKDNKKSE